LPNIFKKICQIFVKKYRQRRQRGQFPSIGWLGWFRKPAG